MNKDLKQKNEFVLALREELKSLYGTRAHYTYGEGDFEAVKKGNGYSLVRRDANQQKDISGFEFSKDLCQRLPCNEQDLLRHVHAFASGQQGIESVLEKDHLQIKIGNKEYSVMTYIDAGYAGPIKLYFIEYPTLSFLTKKVA